jgi:D-alanyl-D-alanine carboxypeptidase
MAVGVAWAVLTLSVQRPAAAADQVKLGDVQQAMANLAKTDGVGAIGEVYVDGRRVGQGTAGSRLLNGKGGRISPDSRYRTASHPRPNSWRPLSSSNWSGKANSAWMTSSATSYPR